MERRVARPLSFSAAFLCGNAGASRRSMRRRDSAGPRFLTFRFVPPPARRRWRLLGHRCLLSLG